MTHPPPPKTKLIEVALPLDVISRESSAEKSIRLGHPSNLHLWWARRPLVAARAVLWSQLVDDPSAHPDKFPTKELQEKERQRLFSVLKRLVTWKNSNDSVILAEARAEIAESCDGNLPSILDPFCGGGSIPLEAQRLGLPSFGGDLNPVSVLISKAMVEFPPLFNDYPPINPANHTDLTLKHWEGMQGMIEDIHYYGKWILERARERIGYLYPKVRLPKEYGREEASVVAYLWTRTVRSPDPAWNDHVPLSHSWLLRTKPGESVVWVEPIVDSVNKKIAYKIREGGTPSKGTMAGRSGAICLVTNTAITRDYIKAESLKGKLGTHLYAIALEGPKGRVYIAPDDLASQPNKPKKFPSGPLSNNSQYMSAPLYGIKTTDSLFTNRQLLSLTTFSNLLEETRVLMEEHGSQLKRFDDGLKLKDNGQGLTAYIDAVITYLAFAIDKLANRNNQLVSWGTGVQCPLHLFTRQAIAMAWSFAEANPLGSSSGSWKLIIDDISRALKSKAWPSFLPSKSNIEQRDAVHRLIEVNSPVVCTDPPYYDNVPFADISDFFYVWLRYNLNNVWPDLCATLLTPKKDELVANAERAGSKESAKEHFEKGMSKVMVQLAQSQNSRYPATIFYAFKQHEIKDGSSASTGWETFLQSLVDAGLLVTATWPLRTERYSRLRARKSAALASSIVLACRPRPDESPMETRGGFVSALKEELPEAIRLLQEQNIAPVDMAQSAIGPGMRIFSRYSKVVEADGSAMPVRTALGLINEVLGEVLSEEEAELDADSRFALTWFEQFGYEPGPYGDADVLARAKVTAVDGVVEAGIAESRGGRVRLLRREELEEEWSPVEDKRRTDWEAAQHLIRLLDRSEAEAAGLLGQLGGVGDRARQLAYLLYAVCEGKNWSEEAVAYNGLIAAWPELTRLVATTGAGQQSIL